ncbi:unnamed protein product [Effrenium voratum]|nr:unnamed protein product [Effrenium voratum]
MGSIYADLVHPQHVPSRMQHKGKVRPDLLLQLGPHPGHDEVRRVLAPEMERWKGNPKPATVVLAALARKGWVQLAGQVLHLMLKEALEVNVFHYSAVISACEDDWRLSLELLDQMKDLDISPNQISFSSASTACANGSCWHLSLHLLHSMPCKRFNLDQVSFNSAIDVCRVEWAGAVALLLEMPRRGWSQDAFSFGAAINACERGSEWQMVLELLSLMRHIRVPVNNISGSAAISACGQKGHRWQLSIGLLGEVLQLRVPDSFVWSATISACETCSVWELALAVLHQMSFNQVPPNVESCTACLSACEKTCHWQHTLLLFSEMDRTFHVSPNIISMSSALAATHRGGQHLHALDLLSRVYTSAWSLKRWWS